MTITIRSAILADLPLIAELIHTLAMEAGTEPNRGFTGQSPLAAP